MSTSRPRILIIDDTPTIHDDFRKILAPHQHQDDLDALESSFFDEDPDDDDFEDFELAHAHQGEEGLELTRQSLVEQRPFAVAFVDMRMPPGWNGIETIRRIWLTDPRVQVVICTAYSDYSWKAVREEFGRTDNLIVLRKPFDNIEVAQLSNALVRKWELSRENEAQLAYLDAEVAKRTHKWRSAEERFSKAFASSPLGFALIDLENRQALDVNPAFVAATSIEETAAQSQPLDEFEIWKDQSEITAILDRLNEGKRVGETVVEVSDAAEMHHMLRISADPFYLQATPCALLVFQDITRQFALENQLKQVQKMEDIGQLAAGIAHDFNNMLTAVQGFTVKALGRDDLAGELRHDLEQILGAGKRAATLTRQLLIFSRKQVTQEVLLDVGELIDGLTPMLVRLVGSTYEIAIRNTLDTPCAVVDASNIEQLLLNLVANARDALGDKGRIGIELDAVELTETAAEQQHPDARAGRFLRVRVSDNGPGIPADVLPKIFDPFFTTKPAGEGTGLGLSSCYGIAKQHRGWMEVDSTVGHGSTFSLLLPESENKQKQTSSSPTAAHPLSAESRAKMRGTEQILIVEDDSTVAGLMEVILRQHGYHPVCVEDGPSALQAWDEAERPFDLVLTDMVMPNGMSGTEVAEALLERKPDLHVVIATGYSQALLEKSVPAGLMERCHLLLKPYDIEKFLRLMRKLFDKTQAEVPV